MYPGNETNQGAMTKFSRLSILGIFYWIFRHTSGRVDTLLIRSEPKSPVAKDHKFASRSDLGKMCIERDACRAI